MDSADRLALLRRATTAGGELAARAFRTDHEVETKAGPLDSVTDVDRAVQERVLAVVGEERPDDPVVGEEADAPTTVPAEGSAWIVDPIDGTNNYVAGSRTWAVAAAATVDGEPTAAVVHAPALGDTVAAGSGETVRDGDPVGVSDRSDPRSFTINPIYGFSPDHQRALGRTVETILGEFGDLRRIGSAQLALAGVATGELEAVVSTKPLNPWDTVAGVHLIREAGGTVTDLDGSPWRHDTPGLLASNGTAHRALVRAFEGPD